MERKNKKRNARMNKARRLAVAQYLTALQKPEGPDIEGLRAAVVEEAVNGLPSDEDMAILEKWGCAGNYMPYSGCVETIRAPLSWRLHYLGAPGGLPEEGAAAALQEAQRLVNNPDWEGPRIHAQLELCSNMVEATALFPALEDVDVYSLAPASSHFAAHIRYC